MLQNSSKNKDHADGADKTWPYDELDGTKPLHNGHRSRALDLNCPLCWDLAPSWSNSGPIPGPFPAQFLVTESVDIGGHLDGDGSDGGILVFNSESRESPNPGLGGAGGGYEVHLRHEHPAGMLLAEQDHPRHHEI